MIGQSPDSDSSASPSLSGTPSTKTATSNTTNTSSPPTTCSPSTRCSRPAPGYDEFQRNQPNGFIGEQDVFDTWFTSSMTPQILARWGEDGDRMTNLYPADLRPQAHDIIRTWAFYTIVKSALHNDNVPWHKAMISGFIVDPDRKKMSKSKGVVVTPMPLVNQFGADAVRYWASNGRPGMDMAFDETVFTIGGKLVTKLYNAGKFVLMQEAEHGEITTELDRAFVQDLRDTVQRATNAFENYEFAHALQITETFFWDAFADNYIELVKRRARSETDLSRTSLSSSNPTPRPKHPPPTLRTLRPNHHRRSLVLDLRPRNRPHLNPPNPLANHLKRPFAHTSSSPLGEVPKAMGATGAKQPQGVSARPFRKAKGARASAAIRAGYAQS